MDHAYATARLEGISRQRIVEMLIPSTIDATLAPRVRTSPRCFVSISPTP
jgi:hypothetical protein